MSCSHCQALDHSLSACPYFAHQLTTEQGQASMVTQRPKNDPYSPYFNPRWRNHPSMSWASGPNVVVHNSQPGMIHGNNFQPPTQSP